jgi:hypothetical protein
MMFVTVVLMDGEEHTVKRRDVQDTKKTAQDMVNV